MWRNYEAPRGYSRFQPLSETFSTVSKTPSFLLMDFFCNHCTQLAPTIAKLIGRRHRQGRSNTSSETAVPHDYALDISECIEWFDAGNQENVRKIIEFTKKYFPNLLEYVLYALNHTRSTEITLPDGFQMNATAVHNLPGKSNRRGCSPPPMDLSIPSILRRSPNRSPSPVEEVVDLTIDETVVELDLTSDASLSPNIDEDIIDEQTVEESSPNHSPSPDGSRTGTLAVLNKIQENLAKLTDSLMENQKTNLECSRLLEHNKRADKEVQTDTSEALKMNNEPRRQKETIIEENVTCNQTARCSEETNYMRKLDELIRSNKKLSISRSLKKVSKIISKHQKAIVKREVKISLNSTDGLSLPHEEARSASQATSSSLRSVTNEPSRTHRHINDIHSSRKQPCSKNLKSRRWSSSTSEESDGDRFWESLQLKRREDVPLISPYLLRSKISLAHVDWPSLISVPEKKCRPKLSSSSISSPALQAHSSKASKRNSQSYSSTGREAEPASSNLTNGREKISKVTVIDPIRSTCTSQQQEQQVSKSSFVAKKHLVDSESFLPMYSIRMLKNSNPISTPNNESRYNFPFQSTNVTVPFRKRSNSSTSGTAEQSKPEAGPSSAK